MALLVNGERIEKVALDEERRALRRAIAEKMPDEEPAVIEQQAREWAAENLIERVLLQQAALRDPEPVPAEIEKDAEVAFRVDRLVNRLTANAARPRRLRALRICFLTWGVLLTENRLPSSPHSRSP